MISHHWLCVLFFPPKKRIFFGLEKNSLLYSFTNKEAIMPKRKNLLSSSAPSKSADNHAQEKKPVMQQTNTTGKKNSTPHHSLREEEEKKKKKKKELLKKNSSDINNQEIGKERSDAQEVERGPTIFDQLPMLKKGTLGFILKPGSSVHHNTISFLYAVLAALLASLAFMYILPNIPAIHIFVLLGLVVSLFVSIQYVLPELRQINFSAPISSPGRLIEQSDTSKQQLFIMEDRVKSN
jgi:hypothetical protein